MNGHASLNRIYRLVWSDVRQSWVVAPETTRSRTKRNGTVGASVAASWDRSTLRGLLGLLAVPLLAVSLGAYAAPPAAGYAPPTTAIAAATLPTNGTVAAGTAAITQAGAQLDINQSSNRAVIDWGSYNVGQDASVNYHVPDSQSSTLNRVLDTQASQILGTITSNGQVFLVNPNGIYFGKSASVDVGGLVATSHDIADADYLAGGTTFKRGNATGAVVNEGQIRAALGGYVALLAPEVRNAGIIVAQLGTVALASGESVTLQFDGNHSLAGLVVEPSRIRALVANGGAVLAPGGVIILSAQALDRLQGGVVQNSGSLEATGMAMQAGRIVLSASDSIQNTGVISANAGVDGSPAGRLSLSAPAIDNQGLISASALGLPLSGGTLELAVGTFNQGAAGALEVAGDAAGGTLTLSASGAVSVAGSVSAAAAAGQGGTVAIASAGSITLSSASVSAAGAAGGGSIRLAGGQTPAPGTPTAPQPTVAILGNSLLDSSSRRGKGGAVELTGAQLGLFDSSRVDASGATGGGTIHVGGGFQGKDSSLANAGATYLASGASLNADATVAGDGGQVVVWSDGVTHALGAISARGAGRGNGGAAEVSSHGQLDFQGTVDTTAVDGRTGSLLLDPADLTISNSADSAVSPSTPFAPTATSSNLSVTTLQNALATSDVTVQTGGDAYVGAGNITIQSDFGWFAKHNLSINAYNDIAINASIIDYAGNLTLNAANGSIRLANDINVVLTKGSLLASAAGDVWEMSLSGGGLAQGAFQVGGTSSFSARDYSVLLDAVGNQFVGAVSLSGGVLGGSVSVYNSQSLLLGTVASASTIALMLTANGSISGAGAISSAGPVWLITAAGSNGSIHFGGSFSAAGALFASADGSGAVWIPQIVGDIALSNIDAGGGITLGNAGTGAMTLIGAMTGTAGSGGHAAGAVTLTGSSIEVGAGIRTAGGNLSLTATSGAVSASSDLNTVAGVNTGTASGSVDVSAATSITLQNVSTVGSYNVSGVGSNAAAVTLAAAAGDVSVGAISTSGGDAVSGGAANRNGGNAGNISVSAGGGRIFLNGDLSAVGGSWTGTAARGLGGYVELLSPVVLSADRLVDTGATSGDVTFMASVDSDGTARALQVNAGAGSVTFAQALGALSPLSSLTVSSALNVTVQGNVTTNAAGGISITDSGTLSLAAQTGPTGSHPITFDTTAGNGPVSLASLTTILQDNVTFSRGNGSIYVGGYLYSAPGRRSNLTFNGAGGGSIWVDRDVGGSGMSNSYALGNISVATATDLTFNWNVAAASLVALNNTGRIAIGVANGTAYSQQYDGALGLQLQTTGSNSSYGGAANVWLYGSVTASAAGAPISITAVNGQVDDYYQASLSTQDGDITLSGTTGVNVDTSYANFLSSGGAISLLSSAGNVAFNDQSAVVSSGGGDITLSGATGLSLSSNYMNFLSSDGAISLLSSAGAVYVYDYNASLSSGHGNITLSGQTSVTLSSNYTNLVASGAGSILIESAAGSVQLSNYDSTLSTVDGTLTVSGQTGISVNNDYITLSTGSGALSLTSLGGSITTPNYYSYHDVLRSSSGAISLRGNGITWGSQYYWYVGQGGGDVIDAGSGKVTVDGGGGQVLIYGALQTTDADSGGTPAILISNASSALSGGAAVLLSSAVAPNGTLRIGELVGGVANVSGDVQQVSYGYTPYDVIDIHVLEVAATGSIAINSNSNTIDLLGNVTLAGSLDVEARGHTTGMALSGDVSATDVTIKTGNGALAIGERQITATSGNVVLQGQGISQTAGSTIRSAGTVTLYGSDYANGSRGDILLAGSIQAADTGAYAVLIDSVSAVQLGNITAGTVAARGGLILGWSNGLYGDVTQAAGTSFQIGTLGGRQYAGNSYLSSFGNEVATLDSFYRSGAFSLYDADTEHNGLTTIGNALNWGNTNGAITLESRGALLIASRIDGGNVILSGAGISDQGGPTVSASGTLELRAQGYDVLLGGAYYSQGGALSIRDANNLQLAYTVSNGNLVFGTAGQSGTVAAAQPVVAAGALTLDGAGFGSGTAQRVAIQSSANDSGVTFTVTGTDMFGRAVSEQISGASSGTAVGAQYFASITAVTASSAAAGLVTVGSATEAIAGNVTQTNLIEAPGISGVVGGSVQLVHPLNTFNSVFDLAAGGNISLYTASSSPLTVSGAVSSTTGNVQLHGEYGIDVAAIGTVSAAAVGSYVRLITEQPNYYGISVEGALAAGLGGVQILSAASFGSGAGSTITSTGGVSISATTPGYGISLAGDINAGASGIQMGSGADITQLGGVLTTPGAVSGLGQYGGTASYSNPAARGPVSLAGANHVGALGPFYVMGGGGTFEFNSSGGKLTLAGNLATSAGNITVTNSGGVLDLAGYSVYAGEYAAAGANIVLQGLGILQAAGSTLRPTGSADGVSPGTGSYGGTITLYGNDGSGNGTMTLLGTLQTENSSSAAIAIYGASGLTLPSISAPNGGLVLGNSTLPNQSISGPITQALGSALDIHTLIVDAASSAVLANTANQIDQLGSIQVGDNLAVVYDFDVYNSLNGLGLTADIVSGGGVRLVAVQGATGNTGALALGGHSIYASGDVFLGAQGVTQDAASVIDANHAGVAGSGGDITVDGGGGSNSITLGGTLITDGVDSTIAIVDATNVTLNVVSAVAGTVALGSALQPLSGAVGQVTESGVINAHTLTGNAGSVTLSSAAIDNLGSFTSSGALSLQEQGGAGPAGLALSGAVRVGAASVIVTTDGALKLGAFGIDASGHDLLLSGVGVSQGTGSAIKSTTAEIDAGSGSIDLFSALNVYTGQVTVNATGDHAAIQGAGQLSLNSLTGRLAPTTSITAWAGTTLVLSPEDLTTTSGSIEFRSLNGNLSTPGNLSTDSGSIGLYASSSGAAAGNVSVNNTLSTGSGNIAIVAQNRVNLSSSVTSASGDLSVSGASVLHLSSTPDAPLLLATAGAGTIRVDATGGGFVMGQNYNYQSDSGAITITAAGSATLGNISSNGDVSVAAVGAVSQETGTAILGNSLAVVATANGAITLADTGNDVAFLSLRSMNGAGTGSGALAYVDASGVAVRQLQTSGNATLTAGGAITADAVDGPGTINAAAFTAKTLSDAGASITLDSPANDVASLTLLSRNAADSALAAGTLRYTDANGLSLTAVGTTASAVLTAGGAVSQSGAIVAQGLGLRGTGAFTLTLATAGGTPANQVSVLASDATGNLAFSDSLALSIGAVNPVGISSGGADVTILAPSISAVGFTIDTRGTSSGAAGGAVSLTTTGSGAAGELAVGSIDSSGLQANVLSGGDAGAITLTAAGDALSIQGAISARGGAAGSGGGSHAGADGTLTLNGLAAAVSQADGATQIDAGTLLISAGHGVSLLATGNTVDFVAANLTGAGAGFTYRSASDYTVGAGSGSVAGIHTQGGAVDLSSAVAITVAEDVSTHGGAFTATGLTGFDSSTAAISTAGDGTFGGGAYIHGGAIDLTTIGGGALSVGSLDSQGYTGALAADGGAVSLVADGLLRSQAINTTGSGSGAGGAVSLSGTSVWLSGSVLTAGGGGTAAGGDISVSGAALLQGGDLTFDTGTGSGNVLFSGTLDSDGTPRSLTIQSGSGTIAFNAAVGGISALDSLLLRSTHSGSAAITQGVAAPIHVASLGLQAGGDVLLDNAGNLIGTLAAALSNGAALTLIDASGVSFGTVSSVDGYVTLAGLSDGIGSSAVSVTAGGAVTQTAQGVITLNGSLTLDTSAFSAGNVELTNGASGGTVLGNTQIGGNFTLDSSGPITQLVDANGAGVDAWLRVGGNLSTPHGTLTEGLNSWNYLAGGAPADGGNLIRMNGVITLSMNGAGGLVATDGIHTVTIAAAALAGGVTVISDAGGQSLTPVANAAAVSLTQGNHIGGTLRITTAGTYSAGGTANATGILESTALNLPGAASFVVQPTTWVGTPPAGSGEILLNLGANVFAGTVSANARGLDVAIADSVALTLGDVVAGQLVLMPTAGVSQAGSGSITASELAISSGGAVLLNGSNHVGTVAVQANGLVGLLFQGVDSGVGGTVQVGTVTPFSGGPAISGVSSNGNAIEIGSAVGLSLAAPVDAGLSTVAITALGERLQLSGDASGGVGGLQLGNADLSNLHAAGGTYFLSSGANDIYLSGVTLPASLGTVTLLSGADIQIATGAGASGITVMAELSASASAGTGQVLLGELGAGHPTISGAAGTISLQGDGGVTLASISTSNGAITVSGPATLGGDTTLASGSGAVSFAGSVDGGYALVINSSGTTTFAAAVGATAPLASLTTDALGSTVINGAGVATLGAQSYGDTLQLGAAAVRLDSSAGNGNLTFAAITGSSELGQSLTLAAGSGAIQVAGTVGAGFTLAGLAIADSGGSTFHGAVSAGAVTLTDTTGTIAFDGTLSATSLTAAAGGFDLVIAGNATVSGASTLANRGGLTLGQSAASVESFVGGLALAGPAGVTLAGTIATVNSSLDLGSSAVSLAADTTLSSGSAALSVGGSVDGAHALTLASQGVTTLGGLLGGSSPLTALTTDAGGSTVLGGGALSLGGALTLNDAVSLTQATTLTVGSLTTGSTFAAGTHDLTLLADSMSLGGIVSGSGHLSLAPTTAGRTIGLAGGAGALSLNVAQWGRLAAGFADVTVGNASSGAVTLGTTGNAVALPNTTILRSGAGVAVAGNVAINGAFLRVDASSASTLSGVASGSGGLQTVGAGALALDGAAANTYTGTTLIGSGATLQVNGNGALASTAAVRDAGTLIINSSNGVNTATVTGTGSVQLGSHNLTLTAADGTLAGVVSGSGGSLTLSGGALTLAGSNTYTGTTTISGGTLTASNAASLGTVAGGTTVGSGGTLALDGSGGAFTLADNLTLSGTGTASSGALRNVAGANTLAGSLTLGAGTVLIAAPAGGLTFAGTVDGPAALVVNATGAVAFQAAIGSGTALASLTTDAGGSTSLHSVISTGAQSYADNVTLNGAYTTTNAAFGIGGSTTLAADTTVSTGSGAATFTGTVDGAHALTVNAGGVTSFAAAVGSSSALASVTTDAAGSSSLHSVASSGAQHYGDNLTLNGTYTTANGAFMAGGTTTLGGDTAIATGSGALELVGAVDGAHALSLVTTGAASLDAAVGASTALASVNASGGTLSLHDVTSSGAQTYAGATTTHSSYKTAGGAVTFNGAVTALGELSVDTTQNHAAGANVTFAGALSSSPAGSYGVHVTAGSGTFTVLGAANLAAVQVLSAQGASLVNAANHIGTLSAAVGSGGLVLRNAQTLDVSVAGINSQGGAVDLRASSGDIVLDGSIVISGAGDLLLGAAGGNFVNHAGASALSTGSGRWIVYSTSPAADTRGGLTPQFKVYNASLDSTLPEATAGADGFVYTVAPVVSPTLTGTVEKIYDSSRSATLAAANYATSGALDGDTVVLNNPLGGVYADKNAGTGKLVSVTGLAIASAHNGAVAVYGYQLASSAASGAVGLIDKASLTVAGLVALNKIYDGSDTALFSVGSAVATGVYEGDTVLIDSVTGVFDAGKNVGTGKDVTAAQIVLSGADLGNYQMLPVSGLTADITPRLLTIVATGNNKPYDGTTTATASLGDNRVAGDSLLLTYTANFLDPAIGANKYVSVELGVAGTDALNYSWNSSAATYADILAGEPQGVSGGIVPPPPPPPSFTPINLPTAAEDSLLDPSYVDGIVTAAVMPAAGPLVESPEVWVRLLNKPAGKALGRVSVLVPSRVSMFTVLLPRVLGAGSSERSRQATLRLESGAALPAWLRFDAATLSLRATGRSPDALPLTALLTVGTERTLIVIAEMGPGAAN